MNNKLAHINSYFGRRVVIYFSVNQGHDQDRNLGVANHLLCHASQKEFVQSRSTYGTDDDDME